MEKAITRVVRLVIEQIVEHMEPEDWAKHISKYSPVILKALKDRAKNIDFDVMTELISGRGADRQNEAQKAMAMRQQGDLSFTTLHEKIGTVDAKQERQRLIEEKLEEAQIAASLQPPTVGGGEAVN